MTDDAYQEYLQTNHWKSIRLKVLDRDGRRCRVCNSPDVLHVHHRTYERAGNEELDDLTTLCDRCHRMFHEETEANDYTKTIQEAISEAYAKCDAQKTSGSLLSLLTGFVDLDYLTAGVHDGHLIVVAGIPSVGKTALLLNMARHFALEERQPVMYVSPIESRLELAERLLAIEGRVDTLSIRNSKVTSAEVERMFHAGGQWFRAKIFIDDSPGQSMMHICAAAKRRRENQGIRVLIIDSIGCIERDRGGFRQEHVAAIARRLKRLARDLQIPVILSAALTRPREQRQGGRPRVSDLGENIALENEADLLLLLHRPSMFNEPYTEGADETLAEVNVAKNRNGPTGEIALTYVKEFVRFETVPMV